METLTMLQSPTIIDGLPAIHPGHFLKEILDEMGLSQAAFARAIGVAPMRVSLVVRGERPVTAELALLLAKALGQSPQYWLNLQTAYDLKTVSKKVQQRLDAVPVLAPVCTICGN